ncbi:MAG: hypothetical protein LBI95_02450 [Holosporales bacterium]|nr:hypothetical protein [Holosporales bacterium]
MHKKNTKIFNIPNFISIKRSVKLIFFARNTQDNIEETAEQIKRAVREKEKEKSKFILPIENQLNCISCISENINTVNAPHATKAPYLAILKRLKKVPQIPEKSSTTSGSNSSMQIFEIINRGLL